MELMEELLTRSTLVKKVVLPFILSVAIPGALSYGILQGSVTNIKEEAQHEQQLNFSRFVRLSDQINLNQRESNEKFGEILRAVGRVEGKLDLRTR